MDEGLVASHRPDVSGAASLAEQAEQARTSRALYEATERQHLQLLTQSVSFLTTIMNWCAKTALQEGATPDMPTLRVAVQAASLRASLSEARVTCVKRLAQYMTSDDSRDALFKDRAVAVVYDVMGALDEKLSRAGYNKWSPFRYPDQWMMFCEMMRKVLAANGLMECASPEVYQKLFEETPSSSEMEVHPKEWEQGNWKVQPDKVRQLYDEMEDIYKQENRPL